MRRKPQSTLVPLSTLGIPQPLHLHLPEFHRVALTMVGCGGTGSHIASGLVALAQALADRNIATDILFIDPDIVEPKNVGRQLFSQADVGRYKADVLASRLNAAFATTVGFAPRKIDSLDTFRVDGALNVVIGAVDNAAARKVIARQVEKAKGGLWHLDVGNDNHSGQVVLGNCGIVDLKRSVALGMVDRLPVPSVVYPDLVKGHREPAKRQTKATSCAELAAEGIQGLMVNRMAAAWACSMLHDFLLGELRYFALAFDLAWGGTRAYALDVPTLAEVAGLKESALCASKGSRRPSH
jgi:PRTRC genetic system ThiF family protein